MIHWGREIGSLGAALLACTLCACGDDSGSTGKDGSGSDPFHNAGGDRGSGGRPTGSGTGGGNPPSSGGAGEASAGEGGGGGGGAEENPSDAGMEASGGTSGGTGGSSSGTGGSSSGTGGSGSGAGGSSSGAGGSSGGTPGGPMGTQPIGALCGNDSHCTQAMGEAVCCANSCELIQNCPESPFYLPCDSASDCARFGGGKVCCDLGSQGFCTKPSGCMGMTLP